MITKLRNILGLTTLEENLARYNSVSEDIQYINSQTDDLSDHYYNKMTNYNHILKSEDYSNEIKKSVKKRYDNFLQDQKKTVIGLVNKRHKLEKELSGLLKNDSLNKAVQELNSIEKAKDNYKLEKISKNVYNDIIKAKKGKVHYSDNFVFWNGKLLIIQRATDDTNANTWVLPGGHVDAGESHVDAAVRELQEETGIVADNVVLAGTYSNDDVMIEYYTSHIDSDTEPQLTLDTSEHQSYKWINIHKGELDEYDFPFNMKENIEKILLSDQKDSAKILKAVNLFISGAISKEVLSDIVKARSGIYENTPENRKLGRVGQKYGSKKEGDVKFEQKRSEGKLNLGRSGKFIEKTKTSPKQTYKALKGWMDSENMKFDVNFAVKTSSIYVTTESKDGVDYKIRLSNHSPAITDGEDWKGVKVDAYDGEIFDVEIDSSVGYKTSDIKNIFSIVSESKKKIEGKDVSPKDVVGTKIEDVVVKYLKDFDLGDDAYGVNREIVSGHIYNIKNFSPEYKKLKEYSYKKYSEGKLTKNYEIDGAVVKVSNNLVSSVDLSKFTPLIGSENKGKRKRLSGRITEAGHRLHSGETNKEEFESEINALLVERFEKSEMDNISLHYLEGLISEDVFEKARTGKYADTSKNRRLKRVGQPYGTKKGEDTKETKEPSKQEETGNKEGKDIPIDQHARQSSETSLQEASKGGNEELRIAAKKELERREKEENVSDQPEKENVSVDMGKSPQDEKLPVSVDQMKERVKELRNKDTDDLNEIEKISKEINELIKKIKQSSEKERVDSGKGVGLSDDEIKSIIDYTGNDYKQINRQLRNKKVSPETQEIVNKISNGLSKLPDHKGKVFRGMAIPDDIDNMIEQWKKGGTVTMDAFTSTSIDKNVASKFEDFQMEIESKTGKDISKVSEFGKKESEILFNVNAKFQVKSLKVKKAKTPFGEKIISVIAVIKEV